MCPVRPQVGRHCASQIEGLGGFQPFLLAVALAGVMRLWRPVGGSANFFPNSVIRGLLAAIGVLLILKQMPHLVGHDTDPWVIWRSSSQMATPLLRPSRRRWSLCCPARHWLVWSALPCC